MQETGRAVAARHAHRAACRGASWLSRGIRGAPGRTRHRCRARVASPPEPLAKACRSARSGQHSLAHAAGSRAVSVAPSQRVRSALPRRRHGDVPVDAGDRRTLAGTANSRFSTWEGAVDGRGAGLIRGLARDAHARGVVMHDDVGGAIARTGVQTRISTRITTPMTIAAVDRRITVSRRRGIIR